MKFAQFDTVVIINNHLKEGIKKGEVGAIVDVFTEPHEAYEVEFVDEEGRTKALIVLRPDEIDMYQ